MQWQFWIIQTLNSVAFGGLLFLLSAGFSLIFGLMRIPNLAHGAFFMLGAYFGYTLLSAQLTFWLAAIVGGLAVGVIGILLERFILRRLAGNEQGQVLVTLGISFIIADICLLVWTGDPMPLPAPAALRAPLRIAGFAFPTYRLVVLAIALGAALAGIGGVLGGPILNAYPGLDTDMLPLALIVVILGGAGSLLGAFVGSFIVGFIYNFGIALVPDLAYFVLFLPMVLVLVFLPQGLFGRVQI